MPEFLYLGLAYITHVFLVSSPILQKTIQVLAVRILHAAATT